MTKVIKIDRKMPCADLYLDDLQDIENLVRAAAINSGWSDAVSFEYTVADQDVYESSAALQVHGGVVKELDVRMFTKSGITQDLISLGGRERPTLHVPSALGNEAWALTAQIREIFKLRRSDLKDTVVSFGDWGFFAISMIFCCSALFGIMGATRVLVLGNWRILAAIALLSWPFFLASLRANKVFLRYSRVDAAERAKRNQESVRQMTANLISGVIGAVIGGLILILIQRHYGLILR